jgi:hypothetical protein
MVAIIRIRVAGVPRGGLVASRAGWDVHRRVTDILLLNLAVL